jgi:translation initiation factor IF-2
MTNTKLTNNLQQDDYYSNIIDDFSEPKNINEVTSKKPASIKLKIKKKIINEDKEEQIETSSISLEKEEDIIIKDPINNIKIKHKKTSNIISFEQPEVIEKPIIIDTDNIIYNKIEDSLNKVSEKNETQKKLEESSIKTKEESIDSDALNKKFWSWKKTFTNYKNNKNIKQDFNQFKKSKDKFEFQNDHFKWPKDYFKKSNNYRKPLKTIGFLEEDNNNSCFFKRSKKSSWWIGHEKNVDDIKQTLTDKTWQKIALKDFLTVKEFSDKIWIQLSKIIAEFLKNWMMVNLNTKVDFETCFIISEVFNITVFKEEQKDVSIASIIEWNISELLKNDDPEKSIVRPPIVSIMWHVDHGKTSILDYIRKTSIAWEEIWWITQKIWAYQVDRGDKKITFIDTPWHEAFGVMRARWARLTDIAIIVVAADEWIKPQTIESINHAKEANVPIIVAINKMDKAWANPEFVKWQLAEQWLQPEDWWWNTIIVPVSALTWLWIDTLLDMILLVAELQDLKADPERFAVATVIESKLDSKLWTLATVLINTWSLHKWDSIICWWSFWRIKFIKDYKWKNIDIAWPSFPVLISWLNNVVEWWDILQVVWDIEIARHKSHEFNLLRASKSINNFEWASLEMLLNRIKTWNLKQLKIVLKADSNWSLEAVKDALLKLSTKEIKVSIIHDWVWEVNNSDVLMAGTSQAILIWYNVWTIWQAKNILSNSKIEYINKKVIYHILEKVWAIITWMIDIKHEDLDLWQAKVKAIFFTSKDKLILWLDVLSWKIENKSKIRVIRNNKKVWNWEVLNLKSWITDVHEMLEKTECWIAFVWDIKVEVWDILEIFKIVQRK